MAKKDQRPKREPQRTCIGCKTVASQRELIRLVHTPEGVFVNQDRKMAGRGAYLHHRRSCWAKGMDGAIAHAFKTELSADDLGRLKVSMDSLPLE